MLPDQPVLAGSTVLVAEDEPVVALELEATLRRQGCGVLGPAATVAAGPSTRQPCRLRMNSR